jgi:hypothetical protein
MTTLSNLERLSRPIMTWMCISFSSICRVIYFTLLKRICLTSYIKSTLYTKLPNVSNMFILQVWFIAMWNLQTFLSILTAKYAFATLDYQERYGGIMINQRSLLNLSLLDGIERQKYYLEVNIMELSQTCGA